MVAFKSLSKLCVVVAFGYSATVTSTEVAQEQPKELLDSGFTSKEYQNATENVEVTEPTKIDTEGPPKYSVEWYLLPEPESRKELRKQLPYDLAYFVPKDCKRPIGPNVEKRIRKYFYMQTVEWYLLPEPESRKGLRKQLPYDLAYFVPKYCKIPIPPEVEKRIMEFSSLSIKEQRSRRAHSYGLHW